MINTATAELLLRMCTGLRYDTSSIIMQYTEFLRLTSTPVRWFVH